MKKVCIVILLNFIFVSLHAQKQPNVVFILADDLGVNDLSIYGSKFHETPNIDALAKKGMVFTQAYSANPLCSPTRASILTGLYPSRIGITLPHCHMNKLVLDKQLAKSAPPNKKTLDAISITRFKTEYYTMSEAFKDNGYATTHIGKWHLGPVPYSPLEHGFDLDIPHSPEPSPLAGGFFYPFPIYDSHGKPGDNLEDLMCDEAVKYIHEHKNEPFFLNYWAWEVHAPWQAKENQIDKYRAKVDPAAPQQNPVYAGMLETLDEVVGRLVKALDDADILDNTVIVFVGDNGPYINSNAQHMPEEFHEVPVSSADPLRNGKGSIYEGGTRVPLIVIWPGKVQPGSISNDLQQSTDFFPTFADMLGWEMPHELQFDGLSMKPILEDGIAIRNEIFCHYPHNRPSTSLRQGDWKLIKWYHYNPDQSHLYELYNLADDMGETTNLFSSI
ncbi:Arylsulfatase A [Spirosomataceae bacterium TFI 002]|nr:Arylsulfatase A [Spirosomataceae bacterium TFI 002]